MIHDIKYNCCCEPTTNVAVEILCKLAKGKSFDEIRKITELDFFRVLGSDGKEFREKVHGLLELLKQGIHRYQETVV